MTVYTTSLAARLPFPVAASVEADGSFSENLARLRAAVDFHAPRSGDEADALIEARYLIDTGDALELMPALIARIAGEISAEEAHDPWPYEPHPAIAKAQRMLAALDAEERAL